MVDTFVAALMRAEADAICGAGYGEVSPDRVNCQVSELAKSLDEQVAAFRDLPLDAGPSVESRRWTPCRYSCAAAPRSP